MKRELSKILTPGTLVDGDLLESSNATYLLAIVVLSPLSIAVL